MNGTYPLSPWDQVPFFQPVKETFFNFLGSVTRIMVADPMRVGIVFSANGSQTIRVSTRPDLASDRGLLIINTGIPLILTHHDVATLVQQEWFAVSSMAGGTLTVIEILLAKWPREE